MDLLYLPSHLRQLGEKIAETIAAPVVLDPRFANPPCGILQFDSWDNVTLCPDGDVQVKAVLYLVAPDNGVEEALIKLVEMAAFLPHNMKTTATADMVPVGGTTPLPALRLGPFDIDDMELE